LGEVLDEIGGIYYKFGKNSEKIGGNWAKLGESSQPWYMFSTLSKDS
jgi:hypothetical protein